MFTNTKVERVNYSNTMLHYNLFFKKKWRTGYEGLKNIKLSPNLKNFENLQNKNIYINYINNSFSFPLITSSFALRKRLEILVSLYCVL